MRISVACGNIGTMTAPDVTRKLVQLAEELGYSTWWILDNLASPSPRPDYSPMDPQVPVVDSFVHLAYAAACTEEIGLGTAVIALPTRPALLTAKQVASLDLLSGGRVRLGVGTGYLEAEMSAVGVPMSERGARTDEYLEAIAAIWSTDPVEYTGRHVTVRGIASRPQPMRTPYLAVGGHADRALRRAVRYGNAWIGGGGLEEIQSTQSRLERFLAEDRRPQELGRLEIVNMVEELDDELFAEYQQLGVAETVIMFEHTGSADDAIALLHKHAPFVNAAGSAITPS